MTSPSPAFPLPRGAGQPLGRKRITQALLGLLQTAYPWATPASTVAQLPENIGAMNLPTLFLVIPREKSDQDQIFGPNRYMLRYGALICAKKDSVRGALSFFTTEMQDILDAVDWAIKQGPVKTGNVASNPPGAPQTLGGLCTNCWYDGETQLINVSTNVGQFGMLAMPISVLVAN